ncbi:MAG: hypothetical protein ACI9X4_000287 [Glaciecola sp.]|jgi:hypothetical protein
MRPWIHLPLFVFLLSLALAGWVLLRDVPVNRQGTVPTLAAEMDSPFRATEAQGVLEGILVDVSGTPQPLADLSTLQDGRVLWTHTDEQGLFRLEGLQEGPLEVSVLAANKLPETLAIPGPATGVRLSLKLPATPAPALAQVEKSPWYGHVRNPRVPSDLEGFEVWLNPTGPPEEIVSGVPRRALTDNEGRFEFPGLIHSEYSISLLPADSKGGMGPDMLVHMGAASRILKHDGSAVSVELLSLGGGLNGTVLDGPSQNAKPVSAAMIMVTALTLGQSDGAVDQVLPAVLTDRTGKWSVKDLKPGRYRVRVRGGGLSGETLLDLDASQTQTVDFPN